MQRVRLDTLLAERGLFPSRARAAASVLAGEVRLGPGRERAAKPGQMVAADVDVAVDDRPRYVSRGGTKLANALDALGLDVAGRRAIDAGASTGGFTDVLLQRGAEHVVAVDVAYGELDWGLRNDDRVTVLERTNVRALSPSDLPYAPDLLVADLSFISLRKVLPALLGCMAPCFDALVMVKPQFEVGKGRVGGGGVVRAALQQHVGEASGRRAGVERSATGHVEAQRVERVGELRPAPGDVAWAIVDGDVDVRRDHLTWLGRPFAAGTQVHLACQHGGSRPCTGGEQASLGEERVEPDPLHGARKGTRAAPVIDITRLCACIGHSP